MVCSVGRRERDDKVRQGNAVRAHSGAELYSLPWPRGADRGPLTLRSRTARSLGSVLVPSW